VREVFLSGTRPVEQLNGKIVTGGKLNSYNILNNLNRNNDKDNHLNWKIWELNTSHPHPYPQNFKASWVIAPSEAKEMIITYKRLELTFGDELLILDEKGNQLESFQGRYSGSFETRKLPGKVRPLLKSDDSFEAYGFLIKQIYWR
jgi:hypothetical protein